MSRPRMALGYAVLLLAVVLAAVGIALGVDFPENLAIVVPAFLAIWLLVGWDG